MRNLGGLDDGGFMDITDFVIAAGGVIALVLGIWALVDLWRGPYGVVSKIGWTIGILIIPIIMSVLYLISRPSSKMQQSTYKIDESPEELNRKYGHGGDL